MIWFVLAPLIPFALLTAACLIGGIWPYVALISVTLFVFGMDRLSHPGPIARDDADRAATQVSLGLAAAHFILLPLGIWALATSGGQGAVRVFVTALALGLFFGQVSNANAHELVHKQNRWLRRLGRAIYASLLFGHHASAHPLVHHVWVASDRDPNSARLGVGFYRFWPRAWFGSFRAGLRAETARRNRQNPAPRWISHPYVGYGMGAMLMLALAYALGGGAGLAALLGLATYAQMQLILSDYVQHYGLQRARLEGGALEPVGPRHAWNASPWYSSALMLNAPRHSDHHINPGRSFPALRLHEDTMPMLPASFPVMSAVALIPPMWRRVMDHRVVHWGGSGAGGAETANLTRSGHVENPVDSSVPDVIAHVGGHTNERRGL